MPAFTAHFTVTGEFLTETARNLLVEENPQCTKLLKTAFPEMTFDSIYEILKGNKKLTGDSNVGISIVDDDDAEYKKRLAYAFGGIYQIRNEFYKPTAYVYSFGYEDAAHAQDLMDPEEFQPKYVPVEVDSIGGSNRKIKAILKQRIMFYAGPGDIHFDLKLDCTKEFAGKTPVLFKPVTWCPEFIETHKDPQKALDEYMKVNGWLDRRGSEETDDYDTDFDDDEDEDSYEDAISTLDIGGMETLARKIIGAEKNSKFPYVAEDGKEHEYVKLQYDEDDPNLDWFEVIGGTLHDLRGTNLDQDVGDFEVVDRVVAKNTDELDWHNTDIHRHWPEARAGWLSPEAEFYGCDYGQHSMLAETLLKKEQEELEQDNWTKIWFGPGDDPPTVLGFTNDTPFICIGKMTDAQKAWLLERGFTIPKW